MAIEMVRVPSETPNINNTDDFIGLRYAYGNQNGYVIGKGQECSYSINGLNFKINSGRLIVQGVECDIDANGVNIAIDDTATKRYYTIYLQVNLALNETKIIAQYDTAIYPKIDTGDDLTQNTIGVANLELYRLVSQSGIISDVDKVVPKVEYTNNIEVKNAINAQNVVLETKTSTRYPLNETDGQLMYRNKSVCVAEVLWVGKNYTAISPNITLSQEQINSLQIGDVLEILFEDWSDGDAINMFGWESKLIYMPICNNPKTMKNGTFEVIDIDVADQYIETSKMFIELNGNILSFQIKKGRKAWSTVIGGGVLSSAYITKVSVIRKKDNSKG